MVIIELIIIIFWAFILSTIYSLLVLILVIISNKTRPKHWKREILNNKLVFYIKTHISIGVLLLILSSIFSHETGIGDHSEIPIGFGQSIQNEDFQWTYFYPNKERRTPNIDDLGILDYAISNDILCAEISHQNSKSPDFDFIVYDLPSGEMKTFASETEYEKYAKENNLPLKSAFYSFGKHFREYLHSRPFWKKWLIP